MYPTRDPRLLRFVSMRRLHRAALFALVAAVILGLAPGRLSFSPRADAAETTGGICFLEDDGQQLCPPAASWPQPSLLNPAVYDAATPAEAQALRDTENQALAGVLADHQLPATDLPQVKSYARADAQAQMWSLIVQALQLPTSQRTTDQQGLVDWMSDQLTQQRFQPAANAAIEYARFAGKDLVGANQVVRTGTEQQITDFLSGLAQPFSSSAVDAADPRPGGYCRYHPPAPFQDEYDESSLSTCFDEPCETFFGCTPPTPDYSDFVKWGQVVVNEESTTLMGAMSTPSFMNEAAAISSATVFGSAAAEAGAVILSGTVLSEVIANSALAAWLFPFTAADATAVTSGVVSSTVDVTAASSAAIGFAFAAIAADIAILAVVGVQVANIDQLPAKLAALVVQSRQPVDAASMVEDPQLAGSAFALFVAATLPVPKVDDPTCDPSGISQTAYNYRTISAGAIEYWPAGSDVARVFDVPHCLNAVPVRPVAVDDPHFAVTDTSTGDVTSSADITVSQLAGDPAEVARVSGNWFVLHAAGSGAESQALGLHYTDWTGQRRIAWMTHSSDGYEFFGVRPGGDVSNIDPDTCQQDGTCFTSDSLQYVGPNGDHYTAHLVPYVPPAATTVPSTTGQPGYSADSAFSAHTVQFASGGFAPAGAVGPMSYSWRFQKSGCGDPCQTIPPGGTQEVPDYTDPVTGPSADYTWQTSGTYHVQLTATDSQGKTAVTTLSVPVQGVAPTLTLAKDCATVPDPVACNNFPTVAGGTETLFGGVTLTGSLDHVEVWVDWGDGTSGSYQAAGDHALTVGNSDLTLARQDAHTFLLHGTHVYAEPGYYHVTVHAVNQAGQPDTRDLMETVRGPQQITFGSLANHQYGDSFQVQATGSPSGIPVTFTSGPAAVCRTSDDTTGSTITAVGVGTCTVTAHQAGVGPVYSAADPVSRSFAVHPAALTVLAEDKTKVYGAPDPTYTAHLIGAQNGDTADSLGVVLTGPPSGSGAGSYDIVPSGVSDPDYTVTYQKGRLDIARAPLTVTPHDVTRAYGSAAATYTATFDGLVNGDTASDITGLRLTGAPQGAHVGQYDIRADSAKDPNYDYTYRHGTETITPAPLTVTAKDLTHPYGSSASYTASFSGLVNGETGIPGLKVSGAPAGSDVGQYPVVASGSDPDYAITFVNGTEQITPAPLTIRADDASRMYGAPSPAYTASFSGLRNGDSAGDITGLTLTGAPSKAGAGSYPITPAGGTDPNYAITFVAGTETVTKAPLTVTADDRAKVYGAPDPAFTAGFQGLVNGDDTSAVHGLAFTTAPSGSHVGSYSIVPGNATSANYAITYVPGTEKITPAPLTITADSKTTKFGTVAAYTWKGQGWVNGDADSAIGTAPTCQATVKGAAASATTLPGLYPAAIACSGAVDPDYSIAYASGSLTVDPVIRLDQTGLPGTVAKRATLDGRAVALPSGDVEVAYGTSHSFSFPAVVSDPIGTLYMTLTLGSQGTVTSNVTSTASYTTMSALVTAAVASGGVDKPTATALTSSWTTVQNDLKAGKTTQGRSALKSFAGLVAAQTGKKIKIATAATLLVYAQDVYTFEGGTGLV